MSHLRLLLLCLALSVRSASWQDTMLVYLWNNTTPGIALTQNAIHGINHAVGSVTAVQIGNIPDGILPEYCTTFVDCPPPTSIQNCQWTYDHQNIYLDTLLFITCRPLTNGICYTATNYAVGSPLVWWSVARQQWFNGTISAISNLHVETFADSTTAWAGIIEWTGTQGISGDSGGPAFLPNGDFLCSLQSINIEAGTTQGRFLYPQGVVYRPTPPGAAGLSALFNSDPDR